jgi:outer membrane protein TolC
MRAWRVILLFCLVSLCRFAVEYECFAGELGGNCDVDESLALNNLSRTHDLSSTKCRNPASTIVAVKNSSADLVGKVELDLALLVDIALENCPETRISWQLVRSAEANKSRAYAAFFPTLSLASSLARRHIDEPMTSDESFYVSVATTPSVRMNCTLFTFGANRATAQAAKHALASELYRHNRALQTLLFRVQTGYFSLNAILSSWDARKENLRDAVATCKLAEARLQAGLGDRQSFLQAKAALLRAQCELDEVAASAEKIRADLASTVGVCVSSKFRIMRSSLPEEMELLNLDVEQLVSEALSSRRDVLAKYAQFQSMECVEKASKILGGPRIIGAVEYAAQDYKHFGSGKNFAFSIGLSWDISCGLEKFHHWREQQAQRKIAFENLRATELRAAGEVWAQYFAYLSAHRRLHSAKGLLTAATESFKAAELAYRNGLGNFIDLLNAQNVLAMARENIATAEGSFSTALAALAYATGSLERLCQ